MGGGGGGGGGGGVVVSGGGLTRPPVFLKIPPPTFLPKKRETHLGSAIVRHSTILLLFLVNTCWAPGPRRRAYNAPPDPSSDALPTAT